LKTIETMYAMFFDGGDLPISIVRVEHNTKSRAGWWMIAI